MNDVIYHGVDRKIAIWRGCCRGEGVHWYGDYSGRAGHKGVAIEVDCLSDAGQFIGHLKSIGWFFGKWDHQDNMGLDYIVSWRLNRFEEVKA